MKLDEHFCIDGVMVHMESVGAAVKDNELVVQIDAEVDVCNLTPWAKYCKDFGTALNWYKRLIIDDLF